MGTDFHCAIIRRNNIPGILSMSVVVRKKLQVTHPMGFHMRPKAAFAEVAGQFEAEIMVYWEGRAFNGKRMWDLMLVAADMGSEFECEANGPDAEQALEALATVLSLDHDADS
jgi:phosphocarrier protein HPr